MQGSGAQLAAASEASVSGNCASLVPGAKRRPWPWREADRRHNRKPEGKQTSAWALKAQATQQRRRRFNCTSPLPSKNGPCADSARVGRTSPVALSRVRRGSRGSSCPRWNSTLPLRITDAPLTPLPALPVHDSHAAPWGLVYAPRSRRALKEAPLRGCDQACAARPRPWRRVGRSSGLPCSLWVNQLPAQ